MTRGLNKVMIIGNLGQDPEMRYTPSGRPLTKFRVATNRSWTAENGEKQTETEWFNVVAWERLAEISKERFTKGSRVYVEGRLQSHNWEDSEGKQHKSIEIVARDILLLSERKAENGSNDSDEDDEVYPF